MLDTLRKGAGTWVVKIFLGVLVLSFAAWGIGDIFRIRPDTAVASVGDMEISQNAFSRAFSRQLNDLQRRLGGGLDAETARRFGLAQQTLDTLVTQALYDQATQDLGLIAGDAAIRDEIAANPAFKDQLGRFDRFRFEQILRQNGFSEQSYIVQRRGELTRQQLFEAVSIGGRAPEDLVRAIYRYREQRRVVETIVLPHERFTAPDDADTGLLESFHQSHATRYTAPELRALTFIALRPADLTKEISVDPADVRALYDSRIDNFTVPETREIEQILVQDKDLAQRIADRLSEGGEFLAVAAELASVAEADVKLGTLSREDLPAEVRDTVFALTANQPSQPVQSPFGWHVFRVTKISPGHLQAFDEVREALENELKLERATDALYELTNQIDDALAGGAHLEEVAERFRLKLHVVDAVDASGNDADGKPVEGLPASSNFLTVAFETALSVEPVIEEGQNGEHFMLRVDRITPPAVRPLADVRAQVLADWQAEQRREQAETMAKQLAERARSGETMESLTQSTGFDSRQSKPLSRGELGAKAGIDRASVEAVFELKAGEVRVGADPAGTAAVVVRLKEIVEADPSAAPDRVDALSKSLTAAVASDVIEQFRRALEASHDVEINQRAVDAIFSSMSAER